MTRPRADLAEQAQVLLHLEHGALQRARTVTSGIVSAPPAAARPGIAQPLQAIAHRGGALELQVRGRRPHLAFEAGDERVELRLRLERSRSSGAFGTVT